MSVSVKAIPLTATTSGLVSVKVRVEVPLTTIVAKLNALAMPILPTARVALAVPPVPPLVELTAPVVFE